MYLSLDVDLQNKEVEKVRKEKRKVEEDRDDLKEKYKKAQVSLKRVRLGRSLEQWQKEVQEEKVRAEYWEKKNHDPTVELEELKSKVEDLEAALHGSELRIEQFEVQEDCLKEELHQVKGQVRDRDYIIGEAIAQIREVAESVQDLVVRADALSMMYESTSDKGREEVEKENLEITHPYGIRTKTISMDQKFEQLQKDIQDQLQEQLAKMQNNMREQILEVQRSMMAKMA
ncbi:prelamin-A/C-like [Gossypium hirsutum]|uniref:Prelamin-A/C-like n=1 Tax=Gossypium hirsutum TaxID=3635 RepID=A0ABM2ZCS3_GOSHI|nr:prelamin-A/C-like [Gossypium hirsutum]